MSSDPQAKATTREVHQSLDSPVGIIHKNIKIINCSLNVDSLEHTAGVRMNE